MIDHEDDLSDDQRAEAAWMRAAQVAAAKHVAPGFWPMLAGAVLLGVSWVLAFRAVAHLGGWWWPVAAGWAATPIPYHVIGLIRVHRHQKAQQDTPTGEQVDQIRVRWDAYQRKRWWQRNGLTTPSVWALWVFRDVPRSALAGYALNLWFPTAVAVAAGVVIAVWPMVSRALPNRRLDTMMNMMIVPKGSGGLPTPEI